MSGIKLLLAPIATEMEGGNIRLRSRSGDNVGTLTQTIVMKASDFDTFVAWVRDTLGNGTASFTLQSLSVLRRAADASVGRGRRVCRHDDAQSVRRLMQMRGSGQR